TQARGVGICRFMARTAPLHPAADAPSRAERTARDTPLAAPWAGWTVAARVVLLGVVILTPLLFCYSTIDAHESLKTTFLQVAALALLAFAAARCGSWRQLAADLRRLLASPVSLAVLLGCLSAVVSTVLSISPRVSLQGLPESCAGLGTVLALAVVF